MGAFKVGVMNYGGGGGGKMKNEGMREYLET
jgi:hypothetical protein